MTTFAEELHALEARLEQLETHPCAVGDWHRFEARVARTLINFPCGDRERATLHMLRVRAQLHIELAA